MSNLPTTDSSIVADAYKYGQSELGRRGRGPRSDDNMSSPVDTGDFMERVARVDEMMGQHPKSYNNSQSTEFLVKDSNFNKEISPITDGTTGEPVRTSNTGTYTNHDKNRGYNYK